MLSIQSFFSKADAFSKLFEESAEEVRKSADVLMELIKSSPDGFNLETFSRIRQHNKQINEEIVTLLCQSFITPLEREDLDALSRALDRIPKTIDKFSIRMLFSKSYLPADYFDLQAGILAEAAGVVYEMVRQLWHQPHLSKIKEENDRLHILEGKADKLVIEMQHDLYSGKYEAMQVIVLRDLLELLEKVIDRCRDAGNVVFHIVLKNT